MASARFYPEGGRAMRTQEEVEAEVYEVLAASMEPGLDERHTIAFGAAVMGLMWALGSDEFGRPSVTLAPQPSVQP
jgi:hypothetical protein